MKIKPYKTGEGACRRMKKHNTTEVTCAVVKWFIGEGGNGYVIVTKDTVYGMGKTQNPLSDPGGVIRDL